MRVSLVGWIGGFESVFVFVLYCIRGHYSEDMPLSIHYESMENIKCWDYLPS